MRNTVLSIMVPASLAAPNPEILQQFLPPISVQPGTNVIEEIRDIASEVVKNQENENSSGIENVEEKYVVIDDDRPMFGNDARNDRYYHNGRWYYDPNPFKPNGGTYSDQQEKKYWDWWYQQPKPLKVVEKSENSKPASFVNPAQPIEPVYMNSYWTNGPKPARKPVKNDLPTNWTPTTFYDQSQETNALIMMMLLDNDNDDNSKMDKLIPLLMLQDPNSMQNQNIWNNPLFYMSMIDDEDETSCDKKYKVVRDEADVDFITKTGALLEPIIGDPWDVIIDDDVNKVDYQYIGCLAQAKESKKSNKDLLLPLMMSGIFNNADSFANMDPMMFLLLQKSAGNGGKWSKNLLPLLLTSGNQPIEPGLMMLLLEEQACDIKYHIPDFFYKKVNHPDGEKLAKDTNAQSVKDHFKVAIPEYAACIAAADDDGHEDFIMLMMLSGMGMM